jgi:hypothetical protein
MAITASIALTVPSLPDNDVWFANSQAWANYWKDVSGTVILNPVTTDVYSPILYDTSINPVVMNVDGVDYNVVTVAMFQSILAQLQNLDFSYQLFRTNLKQGGLITEAQ